MLGQPLDLAVDVRLDSADDTGNACFEAEVFHGDGRVDASRVRVIVVSGNQGQDAVVRIRSSAVVDEPVVGVVLRSICGQKASRRYDFLTDFPVETRAAAVPTIIPPVISNATPTADGSAPGPVAAPRAAAVVAPRDAVVRRAPRVLSAPIVKAPVKPAPKPVQAKESAPAAQPVAKPAAEAPDNKPRLKLEAAPAPDTRAVQLKTTADLLVDPAEDPQKRASAAAAWRELNNLPVENAPEKQRLLTLEAESKTLKALLAKNEADFKLRLERLEGSRNDDGLLYTLGGLLFAALAAAGFWWNRARQNAKDVGADWSNQSEPPVLERSRPAPLSRSAALVEDAPPNTFPGASHDIAELDASLFEDLKKLNAATMPAKPVPPPSSVSAKAVPARSVYPEDFLDVQQHADFFVSLGQYDQAIDVLTNSIDDNIEVNPLAYLELLKIHHTLGRQAEYNQLRDAFNRIFNCQLPMFSSFTDEGKPLEAYPAVLRNIETQWGSPEVLELMESCMFREPGAALSQVFDLAAYRELLLLYAMAKDAGRRTTPSSFGTLPMDTQPMLDRGVRPSNRAALLPQAAQPMDMSFSQETSITQPMLLMPDTPASELAPLPPEPAAVSTRQPLDLDLDLDLNLDFSNSELLAMQEPPAKQAAALDLAPLDLDLGLGPMDPQLPAVAPAVAETPPLPLIDTHMLEFDLFDPNTEAKISPKAK